MLEVIVIILMIGLIFIALKNSKKNKILDRLDYIDTYYFPQRVSDAIIKKYPHLTKDDANLVIDGLREYFKVAAIADGKMVSMPSQVVDVAWHEFLLFTRQYETFCKNAFGRYFHHHPAEGLINSKSTLDKGMILCWKIACKLEDIDPNNPDDMPLIFKIDKDLKIPDGFVYTKESIKALSSKSNQASCGGGACGGGCGGSSSSSSSNHNSTDSISSDGGGCSGGGCGGGCGGS